MSTSTSKLGLVMPDPADTMSSGDDVLAANYVKIDAAMGCKISTTAPTPPAAFTGKLWDDTVNDERNIYDGASFHPFLGTSWQKGESAYVAYTPQVSTGSEVLVTSKTVPMISGAKYLIEWSTFLKWAATFIPVVGAVFSIKLKIDASFVKTQALPDYGGSSANLGSSFSGFFEYTPGASSTVTLGLYLNGSAGSGNSAVLNVGNSQTSLRVERWAL